MRDYGKIHCTFWTSATIRALDDDGKTLAAYILSTEHGNLLGCFRLPIAYIEDDLGWNRKRISTTLDHLAEAGFALHDGSTQWIFIHRYLRWNPIENPNQSKAVAKIFQSIPDASPTKFLTAAALVLLASRYQWADPLDFRNPFETLSERFRNPFETLSKPYLPHLARVSKPVSVSGAVTGAVAVEDKKPRTTAETNTIPADERPETAQSESVGASPEPSAAIVKRKRVAPAHIIGRVLALWDSIWDAEMGSPYIRTNGGKEAASAKRLQKAAEGAALAPGSVEAAMRRFFADSFYRGKDFSAFVSHFAEFTHDRPTKGERFTSRDPLFEGLDYGNGKDGGGNPGLLTGGVPGDAQGRDDGDPPSVDGRLSRYG